MDTITIVENVIATMTVTILSAGTGFVFQATGLSAQQSFGAATVVLFFLGLLFLTARKHSPKVSRRLTEGLLEKALRVKGDEVDEDKRAFKDKIVERVLLEKFGTEPNQNSLVREYNNQVACESKICEAFYNAKKVKILSARGEKYFVGSRSLLYNLYREKPARSFEVEMLVLSPESEHITESHAKDLGHRSAEEIRGKMNRALNYLKHIAEQDKHFEVKCYNEKPNFKILIFDDTMFVSSFAGGGRKNDHNAKMFQLTRDGNPLFAGFERYFDDLSKHSVTPQ